MTWLALDAPPITLIHPDHRPLALGVMGLLRYRLPEVAARPHQPRGPWSGMGNERLLRRLFQLNDEALAVIGPQRREVAIAGVWRLLAGIADRRRAEMLALYHGLAVEPTRPLTYAQAGSVYDLTAAQARRLCGAAEADLRAAPGLAELRQQLARDSPPRPTPGIIGSQFAVRSSRFAVRSTVLTGHAPAPSHDLADRPQLRTANCELELASP